MLWCGPFHGRHSSLLVVVLQENTTNLTEGDLKALRGLLAVTRLRGKFRRKGSESRPQNVVREKKIEHKRWRSKRRVGELKLFSKKVSENARFCLTRHTVRLRCGEKWYEVVKSRVN